MDERATYRKFLFVYGTLMKGLRQDWQVKVGARLAGHGSIAGRLYDLGDYPGAVWSMDGRGQVLGELYELHNPDIAIAILDEYEEFFPAQPEKSLFVRKVVPVTMENGTQKEAWVYFYNRKVDEADWIPGGNYRDRISARK